MADTLEQILAELKKINQTTKTNQDATKETNEQLKTSADLLKEQNEQYEDINKHIEAELKLQEDIKKELREVGKQDKERKKALKEQLKFSEEQLDNLKKQTKAYEKLAKGLDKTKKVLGATFNVAKRLNDSMTRVTGIDFTKIYSFDRAREGALALDDLGKSLTKNGVLTENFAKDIVKTSDRLEQFGIVNDDVAQAQNTLNNSVSRFTLMTKGQRAALRDTVAILEKNRRAGDASAATINNLTNVFGKSAEESEQLTMKMAAASEAMLIPAKAGYEAFLQATPRLALYTENYGREFQKLQAIAKATGVEISNILQITEGFDTFEDAARKTSQLNAMFGTQLNSIDLLNMSDAERIDTIKEQLRLQGKQVSTLAKYEKLSLARILGVDAATLTAGFKDVGDEVDALIVRGENADAAAFKESLKNAVSVKETLQTAMNNLKNMIDADLIPALNKVAKGLMDKTFKKSMKESAEALVPWYETVADLGMKAAQKIGASIAEMTGKLDVANMFGLGEVMALIGTVAGGGIGLAGLKKGYDKLTSKKGKPSSATPKKLRPATRPRPQAKSPTTAKPKSRGLKMPKGAKAKGKLGALTALAAFMGLSGENDGDAFSNTLRVLSGILTVIPEGVSSLIGLGGFVAADKYDEDRRTTATPISVAVPQAPRQLSPEEAARVHSSAKKNTAGTTTNPELDAIANQIADKVAKSFNPVINMTAYVGDKQTTVRLVKDALNSSYPLGRATSGGG